MKWINNLGYEVDDSQLSGFEDDPNWPPRGMCMHPSHDPPMLILVPPGKVYRHVCPGCGRVSRMAGSAVWC